MSKKSRLSAGAALLEAAPQGVEKADKLKPFQKENGPRFRWDFRRGTAGLLAVLVSFAACAAPASAAKPQDSSKAGAIRVGYVENYGITTNPKSGKHSGYNYEYLMEIAKYTGWEYQFFAFEWDEGLEKLQQGEIDILGPLQKTNARAAQLDYPRREIGFEQGALYASQSNVDIFYNDVDYFDGMTVGVWPGNYFNDWLDEYCESNGISVNRVNADAADFDIGLQSGEFDAVMAGSILDIPGAVVVAEITTQPCYFATTKGNTEVLDGLNMALDAIFLQDAYFSAKLDEKYYGGKAINRPAFTKEEAEYIQSAPELTFACDSGWDPIEYYDSAAGAFKGIGVELIRELGAESGLSIGMIPSASREESVRLVQSGEAQLMLCFAESMEEQPLRQSDLILSVPGLLVGSLPQNENEAVSVLIPEFAQESAMAVKAQFPRYQYAECRDVQDGLNTMKRQGGLVFGDSHTVNQFLRGEGGDGYVSIPTDAKFSLVAGVSAAESHLLVSILNKSIRRLSAERVNSILFDNAAAQIPRVSVWTMNRNSVLLIAGMVLLGFTLLVGSILFVSRKTKTKLEQLAYFDRMTGVSTFSKFMPDAAAVLRHAFPREYMIVCIDVDNFKYVNDTFGYDVGNQILVEISENFKANKLPGELIARSGADNFLLFTKALQGSRLDWQFERMTDLNSRMEQLALGQYKLVFTAGVYVIENVSESINLIIDKANIARKSVKGSHASRFALYTPQMEEDAEWRKEVTLSMESALQRHEFVPYLQPQFSLKDETVIGAEALVRWVRPDGELIFPDRFIPLFEQNGFIRKLDYYMFEQVCGLLKKWRESKTGLVQVSVNLSRLHLDNRRLAAELLEICERYGVAPGCLELELTESAVFNNTTQLIETIKSLRTAGFAISIDDFGSGYSSLNLLKDLPMDVLKIDKGFLDDATDGNGRLVIAKVLELFREMHIVTVAEGVETREQADMLREMGCDIAQGYYYARPIRVDELEALLENKK